MNTDIDDGTTIGGDPESFAVDSVGNCIPPFIMEKTYGLQVIAGDADATGYIKHPEYVHGNLVEFNGKMIPEYIVMSDGAAIEYTLKPSTSSHEFYDRYMFTKQAAQKMLEPLGLSVYAKPAIRFDSSIFAEVAMSPTFEAAFNFACRMGCDQDFDIYNGQWSVDVDATKVMRRFAGGHIHIACPKFDMHKLYLAFTKLMDIFVGNIHIFNTPFPALEAERQQFYGRPGKIRFQSYKDGTQGIEYRTPSVSLYESFYTVDLVFNAINRVIDLMQKPPVAVDLINLYLDRSLHNITQFNQKDSEIILCELGII
jgi:hypothetical protein